MTIEQLISYIQNNPHSPNPQIIRQMCWALGLSAEDAEKVVAYVTYTPNNANPNVIGPMVASLIPEEEPEDENLNDSEDESTEPTDQPIIEDDTIQEGV